MSVSGPPRWNHNIHHHRLVLDAVGSDTRRVIDIGCGDGLLTSELADRVQQVVGVDIDAASLGRAAAETRSASNVTYLLGDFLTADLEPASFDLVTSIATLHHVGERDGLERMAELLKPGGRLVVIGCARSAAQDMPLEIASVIAHQILSRRRNSWEHSAPTVWPPPLSYSQVRRIVKRQLPGARFRRRLLWRYSIEWVKPR